MDAAQLKQAQEDVGKVLQAYRIRAELWEKRTAAIERYLDTSREPADLQALLDTLRFCNRNERRLLDAIVVKGRTLHDTLRDVKGVLDAHSREIGYALERPEVTRALPGVRPEQFLGMINALIGFTDAFRPMVGSMLDRIELESSFIAHPDTARFKRFERAVRIELRYEERLQQEIKKGYRDLRYSPLLHITPQAVAGFASLVGGAFIMGYVREGNATILGTIGMQYLLQLGAMGCEALAILAVRSRVDPEPVMRRFSQSMGIKHHWWNP